MPMTLTQALVALAASVVIYKTGRYLELIWAGVVLQIIGNGLFINFTPRSSDIFITTSEIVAAFGAGLLFQPPLIAIQAHVSPENMATATATLGFSRNIATSLAIIVGNVVFNAGIDSQKLRLNTIGLPTDVSKIISSHSAAANVKLIESVVDADQRRTVKDAFAASLRGVWIMCTCMCACSIVASLFIRKKVLSTVHVEIKTGLTDKGLGRQSCNGDGSAEG